MVDEGRHVVVDLSYEEALGATARAIQAEGLEVIARVDVRDRFRIVLGHDFRRYTLLEAWAVREALELLTADLDRGATLPIRFAVFELADGETAVVADDRGDHAARILGRLRRLPRAAERPAA
jgi:uncharacterized protein (DUF302 family)